MKLTRLIRICTECNMNWVAPIWEPKWLSIKMAKESHGEYHDMVLNPESNPIAKAWIEQERERIIALIDQKHTAHKGDRTHNDSGECTACEVIAVIKDDNVSEK